MTSPDTAAAPDRIHQALPLTPGYLVLPDGRKNRTLNQETFARVYRFVLCLTGTVPAAQAAVERIYRRALLEGQVSLSAGESAQNLQDLLPLACQEMTPELVAKTLPAQAAKSPVSDGVDFQIIQVADGLARLEPGQAALLALYFFAGMDRSAAAGVLGISTRRAGRALQDGFHRWLAHVQPSAALRGLEAETRFEADLACFAQSIQPAADWVELVESRLLSSPVGPTAAPSVQIPDGSWRKVLTRGLGQTGWSLSRRAAALVGSAILILALAISFELTPREGLLKTSPKTAQPVLVSDREPGYVNLLQGKWVPPAAAACEAWRLRVAALTGASARAVPLSGLTATPQNETGLGWACRVSAEVPAARVQEMRAELAEQLVADGFAQQSGSGQFVSPGRMVQLTMSAPAGCPAESTCSDQQASIVLEAAEDRLGERIAGLLALWQAGGEQSPTHYFLSSSLAKKFPDTASLDTLVGISRALGRKPSFTWRMLENSGQFARIEVSARTLLDRDVFQMIWALEEDHWVAADLDREILFPATQDRLIAADPEGRVVLVDLDSGVQRILTPPGVYFARAENARLRPALSPDGKWLAVGAAQEAITYLVGLETDQQFRIPHKAVSMTWSPDSQSLAMVAADRPASITVFELATHVVSYTCEQKGSIHSLAWSPDGRWLAMTVAQMHTSAFSGESGQLARLLIRIIRPGCQQPRTLHTLAQNWDQEPIQPTPYDLAWAEDGSELWYRDAFSILLKNFEVRPLRQLTVPENNWFEEWVSLYTNYLNPIEAEKNNREKAPGGQLSTSVVSKTDADSPLSVVHVLGSAGQLLASHSAAGQVEHLRWTVEGGSLVLDETDASRSRILRLNPYSGDVIEIASNLDLIALTSELRSLANRRAPAVHAQRAVTSWISTDRTDWPLFDSLEMGFTLRTPAGWSVVEVPGPAGSSHVTITNIQLENVEHPVRLERGDITLQILSQPWQNGMNLPRYVHQSREQAADLGNNSLLQETAVAGRVAFQIEAFRDATSSAKLLYLPTETSLLTLTIQPADTLRENWLRAMLETIAFMDVDEMPLASRLTDKESRLAKEISTVIDPLVVEQTELSSQPNALTLVLASWECTVLSDGKAYSYQRMSRLRYWSDTGQYPLVQYLRSCEDPSAPRMDHVSLSPSQATLFYTTLAPVADSCVSASASLYAVNRPGAGWGSQAVEPARMLGNGATWDQYSGRIAVWQGDRLGVLTSEGVLESHYSAGEPAWLPGPIFWSPDSRYIAYLRYSVDCLRGGAVFLQDLAGGEPVRIGDDVSALEWMDANHIHLTQVDGSGQEIAIVVSDMDLPPERQVIPLSPDQPWLYGEIQDFLGEAVVQDFPSSDGRWSAQLTSLGCRSLDDSGYQYTYQRLSLLDNSGQPVLDLYEEVMYCRSHPFEFQFLGWSPDSRYLYYSYTRHYEYNACLTRTPETIRFNIENGLQAQISGDRQLSPDGSTLAWHFDNHLVIWPQNGEPIHMLKDVFGNGSTQSLAWLTDNETLIAIVSNSNCLSTTPVKVLQISVTTGAVQSLYAPPSGGPALIDLLGEHRGSLYFQDYEQHVWRLDPATGQIERAAWPVVP